MSGPRRRLAHRICSLLALALLAVPTAGAQAPDVELHELDFYVHQNLIDANGLGFYQDRIAEAISDGRLFLQGEQGPFDSACCSAIASASVQAYSGLDVGRPKDDLETIHFGLDLSDLSAIAAGRPSVFYASFLSDCGGISGAIGCAQSPACGDPASLVAVVTEDALDFDLLGTTLVHERGHNTCLTHVSSNTCELMSAAAGGGCLSTSECTKFRSGATATSGICSCHASASSVEADGSICSDSGGDGICSGGVCDAVGSEASVRLFASSDPTFAGYGAGVASALYGDGVRISGLPGDWADELDIAGGVRPTGLANAPSRGVLFAIAPSTGGNAVLAELDPGSGAVLASQTVSGRVGAIALAFDPGATGSSSDDVLWAIDRRSAGVPLIDEWLFTIDPDTGAAADTCLVGPGSETTDNGFFQGLAYDAANAQLYGLGVAGLLSIGTQPCSVTSVVHPLVDATYARDAAALAWSPQTGDLFLVGNQVGGTTLFDSVDTATLLPNHSTIGVDEMTTGGLAALPIAEPGSGVLALAALGVVRGLVRRRPLPSHRRIGAPG